jgi:FtsP/CotA-like multicopper oxidase with cupredoxin domain
MNHIFLFPKRSPDYALVNVTEFDSLNSFHVHGTLLNIYRSGTSLQPNEANNTIMLAPGQRAILEFSFKTAGQYIFHAYQGEYADLGYMGIFDVK